MICRYDNRFQYQLSSNPTLFCKFHDESFSLQEIYSLRERFTYVQQESQHKSKSNNYLNKLEYIVPWILCLIVSTYAGDNAVTINPFEENKDKEFKNPEYPFNKISSHKIPSMIIVPLSDSLGVDDSISLVITRSSGLIEEIIPSDDGKTLEKRITIPEGATYVIPLVAKR